jgi:hypothetical protein
MLWALALRLARNPASGHQNSLCDVPDIHDNNDAGVFRHVPGPGEG